jgi:hypothetical protein
VQKSAALALGELAIMSTSLALCRKSWQASARLMGLLRVTRRLALRAKR